MEHWFSPVTSLLSLPTWVAVVLVAAVLLTLRHLLSFKDPISYTAYLHRKPEEGGALSSLCAWPGCMVDIVFAQQRISGHRSSGLMVDV